MKIRKVGGKYRVDTSVRLSGKRNRFRRKFDSKVEAEKFLAEILKEKHTLRTRKVLGRSTRTIEEMIQKYYSTTQYKDLKPRSKVRAQELVGHFEEFCLQAGITYAHEVTRTVAENYINDIHDRCTGKGREHNYLAAKLLFRIELDREDCAIERMPFPMKSPFKTTKYKPYAMSQEVRLKLRENMDDLFRAVTDILYGSVIRSGELLALNWEQIRDGFLYIEPHEIYNYQTLKNEMWTPKTEEERCVPLNRTCLSALDYLRSYHDGKYVLPDVCRKKRHWILRQLEKTKRKTLKAYPELKSVLYPDDKRKNITPHKYRSTGITDIARTVGDPTIAQKIAGHASLNTTLGHYLDLEKVNMQRGVDALDGLMNK